MSDKHYVFAKTIEIEHEGVTVILGGVWLTEESRAIVGIEIIGPGKSSHKREFIVSGKKEWTEKKNTE